MSLDVGLQAEEIKSIETIPGTTKVDTEGVLLLVESIPELIIIDLRVAPENKQGYIQGSQACRMPRPLVRCWQNTSPHRHANYSAAKSFQGHLTARTIR